MAIRFIGYGSGLGAGNAGTKDGPRSVFAHPDFRKLCHDFHCDKPYIILEPPTASSEDMCHKEDHYIHHEDSIIKALSHLRDTIESTILQSHLPIVLGGDHSQALGTVAGVTRALSPSATRGLIWIDAHLDAHTPESTPSGNAHGMPLASLMGFGPQSFTDLGGQNPMIDPAHVIIIGARSFESEETDLLKTVGVKIYHAQEVKNHGFNIIFQEAVNYLLDRVTHFGISLDLDTFDPCFAPGVGTPEPGGLNPQDVIPALARAFSLAQASWFEISEYNPHVDQDEKTMSIILDIVDQVVQQRGSDCGIQKQA